MFNDSIMLLASKGNEKRGVRLKQRSNDRLGFNEEKELLSKNSQELLFSLCSLGIVLLAATPLLSSYNTKIFQYAQSFLQGVAFLFIFVAHVAHLLFGVCEAGGAPAHGVQISVFKIEVLTRIFVFHLGSAVVAFHAIYPHALVEAKCRADGANVFG